MLVALLMLAIPIDLNQIVEPGSKVEKVSTGYIFTEGPAWRRDGKLIFSDIPGNKLHVLTGSEAAVYREPSGNANGNTIGPDGLLYTAHHGTRNVTRTNKDGSVTVVADKFEGKKLNSPNDVVVRKNGDVYFTDPPYGLGRNQPELDFRGVFLLRKNGQLVALGRDFTTPNGVVFSPDEKVCYVADTQRHHVRAFDVAKDGLFANGRMFADNIPGSPDGMRVDVKGNLYVTAGGGIHVYDPKGAKLGLIEVPENPTNCGWGDKDAKTLYITAQKSVYNIRCKIKGVRF
ncbi:MAG: SMP-30/gluconolactonase/LRE family protein [Chlorobia bacterium]|nr:SMP-30/gluconolactonase/LRE family protein [Fimbriimonadaceae bacterium]